MIKGLLLTATFGLLAFLGFSQVSKFWTSHVGSGSDLVAEKAVARKTFPKKFTLYDLQIEHLQSELSNATGKNPLSHSTIISLPNAAGAIEQFEIVEASNFEPALQEKFPEIRAYSGKGITDPSSTLKLSISPQGIQTMVFRTDKENEFIEPYSLDHKTYAVFSSHRQIGALPWTCSTNDKNVHASIQGKLTSANKGASSTGELKTLRLAQSCNGEYANFFGAFTPAQVGLVLAAFNATLTRCNGIYERDLAVHLNLIARTTEVIFYDPATDPYTNISSWNDELMNTLHNVLGDDAFDIGHMFGASGGGGNAGCIGCVCSNVLATGVQANTETSNYKGGGITSPADSIPMGDNFDIDYVVHEMGHQLGATHTFSYNTEGTGVNKEVGSGITIMGYAGITDYDLAPHSIDIFHEASIEQIQNNLATKTCPVTTVISSNNATPVVAAVSNVTIPISTPFQLTGVAFDANAGDILTFCWEQNDNANSTTNTGAGSSASPTKITGPNFLTWSPTISPTRYFPRLTSILAGSNTTSQLGGDPGMLSEALSSVSRNLNFRLTVRDNSTYSSTAPVKVGQTAYTDVRVSVNAAAGPFMVTVPNTNLSWPGLSSQTITWSVNNTDLAPINCSNVKISLSTDGGLTFPTILAASTPNDGSESVMIPNGSTTTARVKIEGLGNVFFDISDENFTISSPVISYAFSPTTASVISCNTTASATVTLGTKSLGGYIVPIVLSATSGVPGGTNVSFSTNPIIPGNNTNVTLNNSNVLTNGTYDVTITGVSGAITNTAVVSFVVSAGTAPTFTMSPVSTSACVGTSASFTALATGIVTYQWQKSVDNGATWTNVPGATATTLNVNVISQGQDNNLYRVLATAQCNSSLSNAATLRVQLAANIAASGQPSNFSVCEGSNASFSVTATGSPLDYQWQVSVNGGPFVSLTNGGPYMGVTTNTLSISNAPLALNNAMYHAVVSNSACGLVNSNAVTLTVLPKPIVVLSLASSSTLNPSLRSTLSATVSPSGNYSYQWFRNGILVPSITASSFEVTVDDLGEYKVIVTSLTTRCSNISNAISVTDSPSSNLFVYPNPSNGEFQVRYYNAAGGTVKRILTLYDSKGAMVYSRPYSVSGAYGKMEVNLTRLGSGVYSIDLRDMAGKRLATSKVVIK